MMTSIQLVKYLGYQWAAWLEAVHIYTFEMLEEIGELKAYWRVRETVGEDIPVELLYALHGLIEGIDWREISDEDKEKLRQRAGINTQNPTA